MEKASGWKIPYSISMKDDSPFVFAGILWVLSAYVLWPRNAMGSGSVSKFTWSSTAGKTSVLWDRDLGNKKIKLTIMTGTGERFLFSKK
jgi:hypothetical protein